MKKVVFIINRNSVANTRQPVEEAIRNMTYNGKYDITIRYTEYPGHAIKLSSEALKYKAELVVAIGGDGTVNEVAGPLIGTDTTLGIVPMGSGNGLARHLGLPRNPEKALELIFKMKTELIDTCTVNGRHFISIAGIGFDAHVAYLFAKGTRRGFIGYFHIIANEYLNYKPETYKLVFDNGDELITKALFIAFANSNQFGYNTTIAPEARLTDGIIDVCIVKKPMIYRLPVISNLLLLRKLELSPEVNVIKSRSFKVFRENHNIVNIDGEAIEFENELEVKINPLSLKIITNPNVSKV